MYLIIDNNVTHCCVDKNDEDARTLISWILNNGKIVAGGRLLKEYSSEKNGNFEFVKLFNTLNRAGRAIIWKDDVVDEREKKLIADKSCKSDDQHVIALAQVSGARALWSRDKVLKQDFRDKKLIDKPRGRIYCPEGSKKRRAAGIVAISLVCKSS